MSLSKYLLLLASVLAALAPYVVATPCPHLAAAEAAEKAAEAEASSIFSSGRDLLFNHVGFAAPKAANPTFRPRRAYIKAAKKLFEDLRGDVKNCPISPKDMNYDESAGFETITGPGVFQPSSSWLRFFFHDAGTFDHKKQTGGLNGSIGAKCEKEDCFNETSLYIAEDKYATCPNGVAPVGNFFPYNGSVFCCDSAYQCISKYANEEGETIPVCVDGSPETNEMCRPENDGLLPTLDFFREHQREFPIFNSRYPDRCNDSDTHDIYDRKCFVTLADTIVMGAVATVYECSQGHLKLDITLGRQDSKVADPHLPPLPSPTDIIDAEHGAVFKRMGLGKRDQVTLLTGSHSIGGYRRDNSPGLTDCPFVPFDCTPSGQFNSTNVPFDNNVFKVACEGIRMVKVGACDWNDICSDTTMDEEKCPFGLKNTEAFNKCNGGGYGNAFPTPGLVSDKFMCQSNSPSMKGFRHMMVRFAKNQAFFYEQYKIRFNKMANLGYNAIKLFPVNFFPYTY